MRKEWRVKMNRKIFLILFTSVFSLLLIITIVLIKTGQLTNEQTVMELVEKDGSFKRSEPLVVESLISGSITVRPTGFYDDYEDSVIVDLTQADAKEIVNLLSNTTVKRTVETEQENGQLYYIHLNNNGYTMPYQIDVALTLQLNEDENALIYQSEQGGYVTEDLTIYKKLNEIIEKNSPK